MRGLWWSAGWVVLVGAAWVALNAGPLASSLASCSPEESTGAVVLDAPPSARARELVELKATLRSAAWCFVTVSDPAWVVRFDRGGLDEPLWALSVHEDTPEPIVMRPFGTRPGPPWTVRAPATEGEHVLTAVMESFPAWRGSISIRVVP